MSAPTRLVSLDVFRGLTIAGMILVNTPGSWSYVYGPMRHAVWHGCTPTDLVFPFFLFITGTAMWFSYGKFRGQPPVAALPKLVRRVVVIFLIGLALNAFPFVRDYSTLRYLGVLQRIALAFGVAGLACLYLKPKALWLLSLGLLVFYQGALLLGGSGDPYTIEANLVGKFDVAIFGEAHLYQGLGRPFDPEGLLSTLPAAVSVLSGYFCGQYITQHRSEVGFPRALFYAGAAGIVLGLILDLVIPINKSLWTASYVLYTSGWAALCLGTLLWIIDLKGKKGWTMPALVLGTNSLFVYVLSILWVLIYIHLVGFETESGVVNGYSWLYTTVFQPFAGNMNGSLLFAIVHLMIFWLIALPLYRKQIFIKI